MAGITLCLPADVRGCSALLLVVQLTVLLMIPLLVSHADADALCCGWAGRQRHTPGILLV
jgi:hypothetical protein